MMPKICTVALLSVILSWFLGEMGFKNRKILTLLASMLLVGTVNEEIGTLVSKIIPLAADAGIGEACECALKIVGLGYVFGITSDVCTELGEVGVSKAVGLAGKVEIRIVALPYFEKTLERGVRLLK